MQRFPRVIAVAMLAATICSPGLVAATNSFHVPVIHPAASPTTRSSASVMNARANAHASNAVGNPYVNPNVPAGRHASQAAASANANAAEIRSAHVDVGPH
jgi:hypothetical protein